MSSEDLLEGLTEPQRAAVTHRDGPLLVLAGPGSGKTRVITHRAAYLARHVTQPGHILAITFTNKAAGEMADRMQRLAVGPGLSCGTFHSFCARLLRTHAERAGLRPNYSIFDESDQLSAMREALQRIDLSAENFPPSRMLGRVSRAKNDMQSPEGCAEQAANWPDRKLSEIYAVYDTVLAEQNALDFDDLLVKTARLLGDDPELRGRLQDRYRYVLVDEYQDTNHAQYLIARGLALDHENLCVTGDPDQSIYAWRGANLHNILQFEEDFPRAVVVRLEQNYRSTPQILRAAGAVIAHNRRRKEKRLWTVNLDGPPVVVVESEDAQDEAAFVASQIREHVGSGGTYGDVAVFYRVNSLSRPIEAALRDAGLPYQVARGVAFYNRKEIRDVLAYLKVVANPLDGVSLARIINVPARGIGETTVQRLLAHAKATGCPPLEVLRTPEAIPDVGRALRPLRQFAQLISELSAVADGGRVKDTVEFVVRRSGLVALWGTEDDHEALDNVNELITAAAEYDRQHAEGGGSLTDWLTQVSLVSDVDAIDPQIGAVTLMTLHAAKGLEFDIVFIIGVEDGLLPHERSRLESADIEEERRIFFVGMTRARRGLTVTCARWRDVRGVSQRTSRSGFLGELPSDGVTWQTIGESGRRRYHETHEEDDLPASAVEYLHWRRGQRVRHPEFGLGRVLWIEPGSSRTRAGVDFDTFGHKTLVLEYAQLEAVEPDEPEP